MLIRFRRQFRVLRFRRYCLGAIFGFLLVVLVPFSIDGLDHDFYSIESAQTHFATSFDIVSIFVPPKGPAFFLHHSGYGREVHFLPTRRFLITHTSTSRF